jgi:hypothetical protein
MRHDGYNRLYTPGESTTKAQREEMKRLNQPKSRIITEEEWNKLWGNEPYPFKKGA